MYNKVTGKNTEIITEDDGESDIIVIESDSVNNYVYRLLYDGIIDEASDIPSNDFQDAFLLLTQGTIL
jgi:hypothetical protein